MFCTGEERETCGEEKMGCDGCYYNNKLVNSRKSKIEKMMKEIVGEKNLIDIKICASAYNFDYIYSVLFLVNGVRTIHSDFLGIDKSEKCFDAILDTNKKMVERYIRRLKNEKKMDK